jgi:hypothetical protein
MYKEYWEAHEVNMFGGPIMYRHYILISVDGSNRIALDIVEKDESYTNHIGKIISKITEKCDGEVLFSAHSILVDGKGWKAVEDSDPYFKNIEVIEDDEEFINRIADKKLKESDIKKYILCKSGCNLSEAEQIYKACCFNYHGRTRKNLAEAVTNDVDQERYELACLHTHKSRYDRIFLENRILYAKDGQRKLEVINAAISNFRRKACADFLNRMCD